MRRRQGADESDRDHHREPAGKQSSYRRAVHDRAFWCNGVERDTVASFGVAPAFHWLGFRLSRSLSVKTRAIQGNTAAIRSPGFGRRPAHRSNRAATVREWYTHPNSPTSPLLGAWHLGAETPCRMHFATKAYTRLPHGRGSRGILILQGAKAARSPCPRAGSRIGCPSSQFRPALFIILPGES